MTTTCYPLPWTHPPSSSHQPVSVRVFWWKRWNFGGGYLWKSSLLLPVILKMTHPAFIHHSARGDRVHIRPSWRTVRTAQTVTCLHSGLVDRWWEWWSSWTVWGHSCLVSHRKSAAHFHSAGRDRCVCVCASININIYIKGAYCSFISTHYYFLLMSRLTKKSLSLRRPSFSVWKNVSCWRMTVPSEPLSSRARWVTWSTSCSHALISTFDGISEISKTKKSLYVYWSLPQHIK